MCVWWLLEWMLLGLWFGWFIIKMYWAILVRSSCRWMWMSCFDEMHTANNETDEVQIYCFCAVIWGGCVFFASYDADDFVANTKLRDIIRLNTILFFVFFSCCVSWKRLAFISRLFCCSKSFSSTSEMTFIPKASHEHFNVDQKF